MRALGRLGKRDVAIFNRWLLVSRLRVASLGCALAAGLAWNGIGQVALGPIVAITLSMMVLSVVGMRFRRRLEPSLSFLHLQLSAGLVATALAILFGTHGATALFTRPLFLTMIVPAALLSIPLGLAVATGATVLHALVLLAQIGWAPGRLASVEFLVPAALFFIVAQQCFVYGRHLKLKNRALRAVTARLRVSQARIAAQGRLSAELAATGRLLSDTLATAAPLADVSRTIRDRLAADWAAVFRVDGETFGLAGASDPESSAGEVDRLDLPLARWPALATLADARTLVLAGADASRVPGPFTGGRTLATVLLSGLYRSRKMVGFLAVGFQKPLVDAGAWAVPVLAGLSEHAAVAVLNARLLDEVRQASALKSEFVGAISHELRSPLNVILGYQEMLLEEGLGPLTAPQVEAIQRSQGHTMMLLEMITALLDLSRFEAGHLPVARAPMPTNLLLQQIHDEVPESWRRPEVALRLEDDPSLPVIETDVGKLKTVVRNLVHNALKFTERGSVTLGARVTADGEVAITVADTGCGIPREALAYVFDMFRQVPGTQGGGVGLGLHIVRRFADALGATVRVDSEVGKGTCFTVTLPRTGALVPRADARRRADAA